MSAPMLATVQMGVVGVLRIGATAIQWAAAGLVLALTAWLCFRNRPRP